MEVASTKDNRKISKIERGCIQHYCLKGCVLKKGILYEKNVSGILWKDP
jgi:hypothetical protein